MKKLICTVLSVLLFAGMLSVSAAADAPASSDGSEFPNIVLTPQEARYFAGGSRGLRKKLLKIFVSMLETDGYEKAMRFFDYMELENKEEIDRVYFSEEELALLKSGKNALLSVTAPRTTEKYSFLPETIPEDYDCFYFVIVRNDGEEITQSYHLNDSPYTLGQLLRDCKISDPKDIGFVYVQMRYFYFELGRGGISALPYEFGWNEADGKRYYVRSDGTLATGVTEIGEVCCQFDENGTYQGNYTGFTKSSEGRRYWKNGALLQNTWIKVKGKRKYYAGEDGYFVTGTREIQGKTYSFDKNGALTK